MYYYIITLWLMSFPPEIRNTHVSYRTHNNQEFSYSNEIIYKKAPMYFVKDLNTK